MNTILYSRKAIRQLAKIRESGKIVIACKALANMPDCKNVRKLVNHAYDYRLRVGNYRVLFDFDGVVRIVSIEEVRKRDENTY